MQEKSKETLIDNYIEVVEDVLQNTKGNHIQFNYERDLYKEVVNSYKQEKAEKQDLEKFTRLVIEKGISIDHLKYEPYLTNYNWWANKYLGGEEYELTEDEFNFAKEMIEKYE